MDSHRPADQGQQSPGATATSRVALAKAGSTKSIRYFALEPRVLLDAAALATADAVVEAGEQQDAADTAQQQDLSVLVAHLASLYQRDVSAGRAVLFVDIGVPDIEGLLAGIDATRVEIHLLDNTRDGISQIRDVVSQGEPVSSVHIISHGSAASVKLGATTVDAASVESLGDSLRELGTLLTDDADILLYGCNVAATGEGKDLVERLAELTGADVAASTDLTGSANAGGDWDLEYAMGEVRRELLSSDIDNSWEGVLADGWVSDPDLISGQWGVATTRTTDNNEWKFVSTPAGGTGSVFVYLRNATTGAWTLHQTITRAENQFGWDIAAAGNRLVVSAPENGVGVVYGYTYNSGAATNKWTTNAVQTIGRPGVAGGGFEHNDAGDRWGYSLDLAWNGGTSYRLIVGNPNADWWDTPYWAVENERYEAGAAFYANVADHTSNFGAMTEITPTRTNQDRFGDEVAVGYSASNASFWMAVGRDGSNNVQLYNNTTLHVTQTGWAGGTGDFGGQKAQNSVSMGGNLFAIGTNGGSTRVWMLDGTVTTTADYTLASGTGRAVSVYDTSTTAGKVVVSSGSSVLVYNISGGVVTGSDSAAYGALDVEIDPVRGLDLIMANGSGAQSWHYNREPTTSVNPFNTGVSINENNTGYTISAVITSVGAADLDISGALPFGDALVVGSGSTTTYGATITGVGTVNAIYNPSASATLQALDDSESLVDTIALVVSDGQGKQTTTNVTITVTGVNDAPVAVADSFTTNEDTPIYNTVATNDYDVDSNYGAAETLTYSLVTGPSSGTFVFNSDGSFSFDPPALDQELDDGESRAYSFQYRINDGTVFSSTVTVNITVNGANDGPTAVDVNVSATEDQASVSGSVSATDIDNNYVGSAPQDTTITYQLVSTQPPEMTAFNTSTGAFTFAPLASDQSLRAGASRVVTVQYRAYDGQTYGVTKTVTFTINGVNDVPYISATPLAPYQTQQSNSTATYDFRAYFSDVDFGEGNTLVPEAGTLPGGWSATASDSLLLLTIPAGATGDNNIQVRVKDEQGAYSAYQTFVIRIDTANNAPFVKTPIADQIAVAGFEYAMQIPATAFADPDPLPYDNLTYTATLSSGAALPAWLSFDPLTRVLSGNPAAGDVGTITVRVTATDDALSKARGANLSVFDDFTLNVVNPTERNPTLVGAGAAANADLGFSSALSENGITLAVGSPGNDTVRVYRWNGSTFALQSTITGVAGSRFGSSVSLDETGLNLIVGARNEQIGSNVGQGAAYWYSRTADTNNFAYWSKHSAAVAGATANDYFGTSVAINEAGTFAVVGASHYDNGALADAGAAFFFGKPGTSGTYTLAPTHLPKDPSSLDKFGTSVAFDENLIVVSAMGDRNPGGMVTRLEFDDGFGSTAAATFGPTAGTLSTSAQFVTDPTRGGALYLTGADGKVTMNTAVDLGTEWTISSWFKTLRTVGAGEWRTLTRGTNDHHIIIRDDGMLGVYDNAGGSGFVSSGFDTDTLNNTVWHHIAAVAEGTTTTFYVDGVKVGSAVAEKPTDDIVAVGNFQSGTQRFSDFIDDFRVYDRALTASEIRNINSGVDAAPSAAADAGSIYVFSTDLGVQVAKLHAPDAQTGDLLGWAIDVDVYTIGATDRQGAVIVASSIYNNEVVPNGGAVYVWRSVSQASGTLNNGGAGNGTWVLEAKLAPFDATSGDYFGMDVDVDVDADNPTGVGNTGGTRLVVAAPFENANGAYSGAIYAYRHLGGSVGTSTIWQPEKFVDSTPQGGSLTSASFFGSSVAIADTRAVFGARWRDTTYVAGSSNTNEGGVYFTNLLTAGNYTTVLSAETTASSEYFLPVDEMSVFGLDTTGTQGTVAFTEDGQMVYTPPAAYKSLGLGQTATDSFTYVTHVGGETFYNTVNVTIHGVATQPTIENDFILVSSGAPTVLDVLANDEDPASAQPLQILSVDSTGVVGSITNQGGNLVYDPGTAFASLRAGDRVVQTLNYTVMDTLGNPHTATVTLVITGEDDPVEAVNDTVTTPVNQPVVVDVLANDLDDDGLGTLRVVALDTSGALGSAVINADGTVTYVAGNAFRYLKAGETAIDRIVYTVRDDTGNESAGMISVQVIGADDAVVAVDDHVVASAGEQVTINMVANDADPDGDAFEVIGVDTSATLGQVTLNADGTVTYVAVADGPVEDSFSYQIRDALGHVSTATVIISERPAEPVPQQIFAAHDDVATTRGIDPVSISLFDNDALQGEIVGIDRPGNGAVAMVDGVLVYTPDASLENLAAGRVVVDTFTYHVRYEDGRVSSAAVRVYINGTMVSPVFDDEDRFASLAAPAPADAPVVVLSDDAVAETAAAPQDDVARMALDALVEMAAEADSSADAPAGLAAAQRQGDIARPAFSALLGREAKARSAGVDALLRHFQGNAA